MKLAAVIACWCALVCACSTPRASDETAVVSRADLRFRGNQSFSDSKLESVVALDLENLARRTSPKSAIDDAAYTLADFYATQGFPEARVDYEVGVPNQGRLRAEIRIVEGPRARLRDIEFTGLRHFRRADVMAELGFDDLDSMLGPHWFVESELDAAVAKLAHLYIAEGFSRAEVLAPQIQFSTDRRDVRVTIEVREGPRVVIASLEFEAGGIERIERQFDARAFLGRFASPRSVFDVRETLEELYGQEGYPDARVEVREEPRADDTNIEFFVRTTPGTRVTIRSIEVTGNKKTRRGQVIDRLSIEPGDLYDVRKVRESFRALNRSGLFRRVRIELERSDAPERVLQVELEEATSTELFAEPGYGSYEGARLLAGVRENNLFGTTRSASLEGLIAERATRIALGVTEPRIFGTDIDAGISLFSEEREEPSFDKLERGSKLTFSRELGRLLRASIEYSFRRSEVRNVDAAAVLPDDVEDVDISSVALSTTWDLRDSIFDPRSGNLLRVSLEVASAALGSELEFVRVRLADSVFFPLGESSVLGFAWRAGVIAPLGATDVIPIQERFFNGGENSVRSFEENELGPKDPTNEPLGGEAFHVASLELRRKLIGELDGALFYDVGTLVDSSDDFMVFDQLGQALGAGIRYQLPIGPLRLDAGWNPDRAQGEDEWAVHFSIGMAF